MLKKHVQRTAIGIVVVSSIVLGGAIGGVTIVAAAVSCGITALSPVDEITDVVDGAAENLKDSFFNVFATADQKKRKENAAVIVRIGEERQFTKYSIAIAVATAIQESNLENRVYKANGHNDLDSLGLFQQRPSQGWGTPEQILDPVYAANAFYDRLQTIPDRDTRPMMDVALQIQRADPGAYKRRWAWDETALSIVNDAYVGDGQIGNNCTTTNTVGWRAPLDAGYTLGNRFGWRIHPVTGVRSFHEGSDLVSPKGTPIYATHDGTVKIAGPTGNYGNYVLIDNGDGISTGFGHMSEIGAGIKPGVQVRAGQVIGLIGSTGRSTGPHLHYELKVDGKPVDAMEFMRQQGVELDPSRLTR